MKWAFGVEKEWEKEETHKRDIEIAKERKEGFYTAQWIRAIVDAG